ARALVARVGRLADCAVAADHWDAVRGAGAEDGDPQRRLGPRQRLGALPGQERIVGRALERQVDRPALVAREQQRVGELELIEAVLPGRDRRLAEPDPPPEAAHDLSMPVRRRVDRDLLPGAGRLAPVLAAVDLLLERAVELVMLQPAVD